jgi:TolB-like protein/Tfp pilus assembly protein PilF
MLSSAWPSGGLLMIKRFGTFVYDGRRRQVLSDTGDVVHLTPKAFNLLGVLLEAAPGVVSKAELHERLWPGLFVSEATLVGLIKELRRAFNDRDRPSPLIRTSHGVGYAFCEAVQTTEPEPMRTATSPSIAVLPFADFSTDLQNGSFGDCLAEELINSLAQIPRLHVASRTSAFRFRGSTDLVVIGRELHVDHLLEGSVRCCGKRLRITARLVNVADGSHLWSTQYEREMTDVFDIYDEVAESLVKALKPTLSVWRQSRERRQGVDLDPFELYVRGRRRWHQRTPESLRLAIALFQEAIGLNPDYALAHAALADSYSTLGFYGYAPLDEVRAAAKGPADRALALDPERPEPHYAAALSQIWLSSEWPVAERSFRRALEIQPGFAPAHTHYAAFLAVQHRVDEARAHIQKALVLDPLSPAVHGTAALCMFTSRQYSEAVDFGERALKLHPGFAVALYALGLTYCRTREFDKACEAFDQLLSVSERTPYFVAWRALACGLAGRPRDASALAAEIATRQATEYVHPLAQVLAGIGIGDPGTTANALKAYIAAKGAGFQVGHIVPFLGDWALEPPFLAALDRLHLKQAATPA